MAAKPKITAAKSTPALSTSLERAAFSKRLVQAIHSLGLKDSLVGPTFLARNFNHRYAGTPVTVHAARKWLMGEAIPTQAKLICLANWLDVKPEWLRFGDGNLKSEQGRQPALADSGSSHDTMLQTLSTLSIKDQHLVAEFVKLLANRD